MLECYGSAARSAPWARAFVVGAIALFWAGGRRAALPASISARSGGGSGLQQSNAGAIARPA
eukprot:10994166-Lingulodinium_polyedra.AAC.1